MRSTALIVPFDTLKLERVVQLAERLVALALHWLHSKNVPMSGCSLTTCPGRCSKKCATEAAIVRDRCVVCCRAIHFSQPS